MQLLLNLLEEEPVRSAMSLRQPCRCDAYSWWSVWQCVMEQALHQAGPRGYMCAQVGINDFYVRYHTVQLLTLLLQASAQRASKRSGPKMHALPIQLSRFHHGDSLA